MADTAEEARQAGAPIRRNGTCTSDKPYIAVPKAGPDHPARRLPGHVAVHDDGARDVYVVRGGDGP